MSNRQNILKDRTNAVNNQYMDRTYIEKNNETKSYNQQDDIAAAMKNVKAQIQLKFGGQILSDAKDKEFVEKLKKSIDLCLQNERAISSTVQRGEITIRILDDILGFGPLQPALENPEITEIMVTHYTKVYVEKQGKLQLDPTIVFVSEEQLRNVIDKIVQPIGRRIDESDPLVDARLPDGSRVNATIPPISPDGATLTIRKFSKNKLTGKDYLIKGSLSPTMLEFFDIAVRARCNIIISGGTGSGKTTFLNMLSNFCPSSDAIITVEDSCELQLYQDNVRRLEAKPSNNEGKGEVPIRILVKNCLRMRPDRIIVGEIRDGAIVDMFRAMSSGHDGSLTTIHSNNPRDLVDSTIFILFGMSDMRFTEKAIQQLVCSAVDLIIQISRLADGTRKIVNVTHVVGYGKNGASKLKVAADEIEKDKIYLKDIFRFVQTYVDDNGHIHGEYQATGYVPKEIIDKAKANRCNIDLSIYDPKASNWEADMLPPDLQKEIEQERLQEEEQKRLEEMKNAPKYSQQQQQNQSNQMFYGGQGVPTPYPPNYNNGYAGNPQQPQPYPPYNNGAYGNYPQNQ